MGGWRRWSLRARLTIVATALLGAGLCAGMALFAATAAHSVQAALDSGALQSAREIAALVDAGRLPDPVPIGGESTALVQVVDAAGRVRAGSAGADRLVSLLDDAELDRVRAGERLYIDGGRLGLSGRLRVVGVPAGPPRDRQTVLVVVDLSAANASVDVLRKGLAVGAPVLLCVLALVSWRVIGWTLRPVEELRRGAAEITGRGAAQRLPVPAAPDEIGRLAVTLNDMLGRIEAAGARQRTFVSDAAHELRSPLASLRTQLEVAARLGDPGADLAADLLIDVERLARLADDLLLLARLDEGAPPRQREPVDLAGLVSEVTARYSADRVPVVVAPAAGRVPPVEADPAALHRVVANLVDNGIRHAATRVTVEVAGGPAEVQLSVTDDGPGIPAADRQRVFDRFTRLDHGRSRDAGGAGLGLAIVRELVRAHGGNVTLHDADPGLRAVVTLPALPAPVPEPDPEPAGRPTR